jgi:hypothetical protein
MNNVLTFDLRPFEELCGKLPQAVMRAALREAKTQLGVVQKTARTFHRFQSTSGMRPNGRYYRNTGRLERSIQVEMSDDGGRVYLDEGIADYGVYIHSGFKSWESDPFVYEAFDEFREDILNNIGEAVSRAISEL